MENRRVRVLLIDDDEDDYILVRDLLSEISRPAHDLDWVTTFDGGLEAIARTEHDACLLDYILGERNGLELMKIAVGKGSRIPIIFLTGHGDYNVDVEAMKAGAADYLVKGQITADMLDRSIRHSIERKRMDEALYASVLTAKKAEDALRSANRALRALSDFNQALVRQRKESDLLKEVCRIIVEVGGYRFAWVGFVENDEKKTVQPVAQAGYEQGYLKRVHISSGDNQAGQGPTGLAIRTGKPGIAKSILTHADFGLWRAEAIKRGYASSLALPMIAEGRTYGALTIYAEEPDAFDDEEVSLLRRLADNLSYGIASLRTYARRRLAEHALHESEEQLRFLSSRLLTAQEEERKRIARELHDSIGSSLSAIKFNLENTLTQFEQDKSLRESLEFLISITQSTIDEARRIMTDLRPSILDDLGIVTTINWFCRQFQTIYSDIIVEKELCVEEEEVPEPLKIVIFRIIQEALHNVTKYSKAQEVNLSLTKTVEKIHLTIEDNGVGFDTAALFARKNGQRGLGLASMKERAELSGGVFFIRSTLGKGTLIDASWSC